MTTSNTKNNTTHNDTIIDTPTCPHCQETFDIIQQDRDFYQKISPTFDEYTADIPNPKLCPACRERRRLSFRNERNLHIRTCDASQKNIISMYSPDKPFKVYDQKIWRSDSRNPMDYGRDFDFTRTFTEQFKELMKDVPLCALATDFTQQENCDYTNNSGPGKNCYMTFETAYCENTLYSRNIFHSNNTIDCLQVTKMNNCFECIDSESCTGSTFLTLCKDVSFSHHCNNCSNCSYCYDCDGLENKQYHIANKDHHTKEEYLKALTNYTLSNTQKHRPTQGRSYGNENVTNHINIINSSNSHYVSDGHNLENCKYVREFYDAQDCYDCYSRGENTSQSYEIMEGGRNISNCSFIILCRDNISHLLYSFYCNNSSHLFGCTGLRNAEYCIFNKQYTKEEYNKLVPQIIEHMKKTGEWGEQLHPSLSPYGYNETIAMEYCKTETKESYQQDLSPHGYQRSSYQKPQPSVDKIIPGEKLPAHGVADLKKHNPDLITNILKYAIRCEKSGQLFRIVPQEIEFYINHNLPFPRKHPDIRHMERIAKRQ